MNSLLKQYLLLLFATVVSINAAARSNVTPTTARSTGMGDCFVSMFDIDAAIYNQAGLSKQTTTSLLVYFENRFSIKELTSKGIIVGIPTKSGVFSTSFHGFGPAKWMETSFALSYSKQLTPKLSGGIRLNYFGAKLPEENQTISSAGEEIGFIYQLSPTLFAGAHISNPFTIQFQTSAYKEKIPWKFNIGGHALITNELLIAAEVEKTEMQTIILKTGLEWQAATNFHLRGGYNSGPSKLFAGVGFSYRILTTDVAFGYHQILGLTPSVSIKFNFK